MAKEEVTLVIDGESKGAQRALKGTSVSTVALGNVIANVAGVAMRQMAAALRGIANQALAAIAASSALEETIAKFETVFATQIDKANEWASVLVDSFKMSEREAKANLAAFQDLLVPMGMAADAAGRMSFEVVKLSADLGSFNNLPTERVIADVQSALVGNYETMKKYGVVLNATTVQQEALGMGLAASKEELTAADKAQAAYALIVKGSTAAIGDMERTGGSWANTMKGMKARLEDMSAAAGDVIVKNQGLSIVFGILQDAIMQATEWIRAHQLQMAELVKTGIVNLVKGLGFVVDGLNFLSFTWTEVGNAGVKAFGLMLQGARVYMQVVNLYDKSAGNVIKNIDLMITAGDEEVAAGEAAQLKRGIMFERFKTGLDEVAAKIAAVPGMYGPVNEAVIKNAEITQEAAEQKMETTEQLKDLIRGYTEAELEEYMRRTEALWGMMEEGKISREDFTAWVAANGVKFNLTEKKTTEAWKKNWTSAWQKIKAVSSKASDEIVKGEKTFGEALADATKKAMVAHIEEYVDAKIAKLATTVATEVGIATAEAPMSFGATLLMIPLILAASLAAKAAIRAAAGFAEGGMVGPGGMRLPIPSFQSEGAGAPHLVTAHENEVIGTPATLAAAGIGAVTVNVTFEGGISPETDIEEIGRELGEAVREEIRTAV